MFDEDCPDRADQELDELQDPGCSAALSVRGKSYLNAEQLAGLLGVTPRTLARWEDARKGPPRIKIGKLVFYDQDKIPIWLESHEREPVLTSPVRQRGRQ